jgi:hypothetical protein
MQGALQAELTEHGAHAWLGDPHPPVSWPEGWRVRFEPTELIDPEGQIFVREGDVLVASGGLIDGVFGLTDLRLRT